MAEELSPDEITIFHERNGRGDMYREAEQERKPFFVIDEKDSGYSVTYDLLPAGHHLTEESREELEERVSAEVEAILLDEDLSTEELSYSIGDTLGNVFFFEQERTARNVAAMISRIVLDENNWEKDPSAREMAREAAGLDPEGNS
ncbi:hypothetical protein [Natrinema limicola]|uniref:hypothetical protein n=1 Tax=Natrinema limicola TaxID=370323 RepID=UPI00187DA45D|nr:hypothetical protein [Natrinema limicola]